MFLLENAFLKPQAVGEAKNNRVSNKNNDY